MEKRFSAREHDLAYFESDHGFPMAFKSGNWHFAGIRALPDVAHNATAIAKGVEVEQKDRKFVDAVCMAL
jgi:hypothetical protein